MTVKNLSLIKAVGVFREVFPNLNSSLFLGLCFLLEDQIDEVSQEV